MRVVWCGAVLAYNKNYLFIQMYEVGGWGGEEHTQQTRHPLTLPKEILELPLCFTVSSRPMPTKIAIIAGALRQSSGYLYTSITYDTQ